MTRPPTPTGPLPHDPGPGDPGPGDPGPGDPGPGDAGPGDAGLRVLPVRGIGVVSPGDDLAALIAAAAPWLRDGDILVVTSKIVSKAEGRLFTLPPDEPRRTAAREELLAAETARVVARRGPTTIVQTHHGFVMAAAGIDASNVDPNQVVLLPKDPDASARTLRSALRRRLRVNVAVIVSDTMGRPWRNGLTDVALGVAGMEPLRDHRGEVDPYGNELHLTVMAVADELAAAGELVKGKRDQVPVAVVRGYPHRAGMPAGDGPGAVTMIRERASDMFALGTDEARRAGRLDVATLDEAPVHTGAPVPADALDRALAVVGRAAAPGTQFRAGTPPDRPDGSTAAVLCRPPEPADAPALVRFGADVHRLRAALSALGVLSAVIPVGDGPALLLALSGETDATGGSSPR